VEPNDEIVSKVLRRVKELGDMGLRLSESDVRRIIREVMENDQSY